MNFSILRSVFVRNFLSFYSSLTGYTFIAVFVLLNSVAVFGLDPFYYANMANLDMLTTAYPFFLLVLIPAITMGLWAGERRDGTDELLLTMPGSDLDIVFGKYLAAVAIYTVALLFSLVPNYILLNELASPGPAQVAQQQVDAQENAANNAEADAQEAAPSSSHALIQWDLIFKPSIDIGLFFGTYFGYWLIGLPMLAIGMAASFMTRNLTLAWIVGIALCLPLAMLVGLATLTTFLAGSLGAQLARLLEITDSLTAPCRGVFSLMGFVFFAVVIAIMLYLCMILIGTRHWGQRYKLTTSLHYIIRMLALVVIGMSVVAVAWQNEARVDVTSEHLTALDDATKDLLKNLEGDRKVFIDAFVSPDVPESYMRVKKDLENTLHEMQALNPQRIKVKIIETEDLTKQAVFAKERYGIKPQEVLDLTGGQIKAQRIFLGAAVRSGLNRDTIGFFERGIPVEYELIRSVCTVLQEKRKKVGVLATDAPLFGKPSMQGMSSSRWPIIDELEKQYKVVRVDASKPIDPKDFDVLLAVQPSTLDPKAMDHFITAVEQGVPTAIFEDPAPLFAGLPGTDEPRQPPRQMMMYGQMQSPPKGDITRLWKLLHVKFAPGTIVWQDYNPYPKYDFLNRPEFVFIDKGSGAKEPFSEKNPVSSGLQQILFPFPGSISPLKDTPLEFEPLAETGSKTGTVTRDSVRMAERVSQMQGRRVPPTRKPTQETYVIASHIQGETKVPPGAKPTPFEGDASKEPTEAKIDVVLVADLDMFTPTFFELRKQRTQTTLDEVRLEFDNVTFVLNALDALAGDSRFIEIRKRRRKHRPLARIEAQVEKTRLRVAEQTAKQEEAFDKKKEELQDQLTKEVQDLKKKIKAENLDVVEVTRRLAMAQQAAQKQLDAEVGQLETKRDDQIRKLKTEEKEKTDSIRLKYKLLAWLLAPIPPIILGLIVFFMRYSRESVHARQRERAVRSHQH